MSYATSSSQSVPGNPAFFQVAVESEDDSSEEDLSQYPLATANGTFKREDFFEEGKNKKKNRKNKNEKKGEPRT